MIVTEAGKYGIDRNDRCDITKVVFSDLRLSGILAPSELTGVMGNNTVETKATIGLLANGHIIVQAQARPNFTVQSAFIFAQGGTDSKEFLLAIENAKEGSINLDLSIEKIRKLSFNALASDLVLKEDVDEVVASAMAELPHPDFPSLATSVYTEATSYADSAIKPLATQSSVDDRLASKADATRLSDYVTKEVLTDVSSGIGTELAKKADASELTKYATSSAVNELSSEVKDHLASKADKTQLDSYYPVNQASESFNSVTNMLNTRARLSDFNALSNAQSSFVDNVKDFTTYASSHLSFLQSKADTDATNIIYSAKRIDGLRDSVDKLSNSTFALNGTWNKNFNELMNAKDGYWHIGDNYKESPNGWTGWGLVLVIHNYGDCFVIAWDNANNQWHNHFGNGHWDGWQKASDDSKFQNIFKYKNSYKGNLLELDREEDGAYDLYGNMQGTPEGFYGYGLVLKYHNAWNAFLILFDNAQGIWTNRQGPSGWNGWRRFVTSDMIDNLQAQINALKTK